MGVLTWNLFGGFGRSHCGLMGLLSWNLSGGFGRSCCGLMGALTWHLSGRSVKHHEIPGSIAGILAKIRTKILLNTSLALQ
jgi:hypothetical protein